MFDFDLVTMGELLVDLAFTENSQRGYPCYEAVPGGAPANVAIGAKRLGAKTAFIGKIGRDSLSLMLRKTLTDNEVDVSGLVTDPVRNAALALISLDRNGDRSFTFYRENSADLNLRSEEVDQRLLQGCRCFHFGSVAMSGEPSRSAVLYAAKIVADRGGLISYDPNYRPLLWKDQAEALEVMRSALPLCRILKVSEEELQLLSGLDGCLDGMKALAGKYSIPLIFTTLGAKGCRWLFRGKDGSADAYEVGTADTTGAGDSFAAAALCRIVCQYGGLDAMDVPDVQQVAEFACAAGSLTTAAPGAIPALPGLDEVISLLKSGRRKY